MSQLKIAFVDRDGTLIMEPADQQIDRLEKLELVPGVIPAMIRLRDAGYEFVMITNQDGLGTEAFPAINFREPQDFLLQLFSSQGIIFRKVFICPHLPEDKCRCRKPLPGMVTNFLNTHQIDREQSVVIGDRDTDLEFSTNIGVTGLLINPEDTGGWADLVHHILDAPRTASIANNTSETQIQVTVNLDQETPVSISTGIGFFDHMLEQIAKHGGFSLSIAAAGDLHVDAHHTVEDTALALGEAIRRALGDKAGIGRYGFALPMDESRAQVTLDLSGRPYFVFDGVFPGTEVGELPTELVPHFFRSLSDAMRATLHLTVLGENTHHMVEACFKATGRALRQAFVRDGISIPSTKGIL